MRISHFLFIALAVSSCSPKVITQITKSYTPINDKQDIKVFLVQDPIPGGSIEFGIVKVGANSFTQNCTYENVIEIAKSEARKSGGNALKLIEHSLPSVTGSSCHQIVAKILKVSDFNAIAQISKSDSILAKADYALIHFYRPSGLGAIISYDIHLGDTVLCRSKNNSKKTIRLKKAGINSLWAQTEAKEEIPVDFKIGKEYYIRTSVTVGLLIGRPKLELIGNDFGKYEYESIQLSASDFSDKLILNDGRIFNCKITRQDAEEVYFKLLKEKREIETFFKLSEIKEIIKGD